MKACKTCGIEKPISEFTKAPGCKDGVRKDCRKCHSEKNKITDESVRELKNKYLKKYRKDHMEKWKRTPEQQAKINANKRKKYAEDEEFRSKAKLKAKEWQESNPKKRLDQRMRKYGITALDYEKILAEQGGVCAICGSDNPGDKRHSNFHVDHCHNSMEVRGLLCMNCNMGIGKFKDNIQFLQSAIKYLEAANGTVDNLV